MWLPQSVMAAGLIILAIALIDELVLVLNGALAGYQQAETAEADAIERRLAEGE